MKEKMKYSPTDVEVIYFSLCDVIATSGDGALTDSETPGYEPDGWV